MTSQSSSGAYSSLREVVRRFGATDQLVDLDGPVFWADFGGPCEPPPMLLIHGLGASHQHWLRVGAALAQTRRVVALDLPGFGLSPGRLLGAREQAHLVRRFVREVLGSPAVLVGSSFGGTVAMLAASTADGERVVDVVDGVVLVAPSVPIAVGPPDPKVTSDFLAYSLPSIGEAYVRHQVSRDPRRRVLENYDLCFADPRRADAELTEAAVRMAAYRQSVAGGEHDFLAATRTMMAGLRGRKAFDQLTHSIPRPVLLLAARKDRLVKPATMERLSNHNPHWRTHWFGAAGHLPQLEIPDEFRAAVDAWATEFGLD